MHQVHKLATCASKRSSLALIKHFVSKKSLSHAQDLALQLVIVATTTQQLVAKYVKINYRTDPVKYNLNFFRKFRP